MTEVELIARWSELGKLQFRAVNSRMWKTDIELGEVNRSVPGVDKATVNIFQLEK